MNQPVLNFARRSDIPEILRLHHITHEEHRERLPHIFTEPPGDQFRDELYAAFSRFLVVPTPRSKRIIVRRGGGTLLGYVMFTPGSVTTIVRGTQHFLMITDISVAPPARGQGVGTALLQDLRLLAERRKITQIWANIWVGNDASNGLFSSMGYETLSTHVSLDIPIETSASG